MTGILKTLNILFFASADLDFLFFLPTGPVYFELNPSACQADFGFRRHQCLTQSHLKFLL